MPLTLAQKQTLKTDILTNPATVLWQGNQVAISAIAASTAPDNPDANFAIKTWYNLVTAAFVVWKTSVSINAVGDNFVGSELSGLTTANQTRLQTIALFSTAGVNPSLADRRFFFDDVFSGAGGAGTRVKLLALWKRFATNSEKLFATGTGSDASPATMGYETALSVADIEAARTS